MIRHSEKVLVWYLLDRTVYGPDVEFFRIPEGEGEHAEPARGYAHVVPILNQRAECVGWMKKDAYDAQLARGGEEPSRYDD